MKELLKEVLLNVHFRAFAKKIWPKEGGRLKPQKPSPTVDPPLRMYHHSLYHYHTLLQSITNTSFTSMTISGYLY